MTEKLEDTSYVFLNELSKKITGVEESATSYSLMNRIENWIEYESEFYGKEIGFIVVPDVIAVCFLFLENSVEMQICMTKNKKTIEKLKAQVKKIQEIKTLTTRQLSQLMFYSEKGFRFFDKYPTDEAYNEAFWEIKDKFRQMIINFYEKTKLVQKKKASLLMVSGLLNSIAYCTTYSEPKLGKSTKALIKTIADSLQETFT